MTKDELRGFIESFAERPDDRPDWLQEFNDAPRTGYYFFLYQYANTLRPGVMLEIGTGKGGGAAHLAFGNRDGIVITIDSNPESKADVEAMRIPNVVAILGDSLQVLREMAWMPPIELLFIDAAHVGPRALAEYQAYLPHVKPGSLILFDDVGLNAGMREMWNSIPEPKVSCDHLHIESGFGVALHEP